MLSFQYPRIKSQTGPVALIPLQYKSKATSKEIGEGRKVALLAK